MRSVDLGTHLLLVLGLASSLASCQSRSSGTDLSRDYVLSSSDPAVDNVTGILMRYEDDWLPGTCVGVTRHLKNDIVRIEWKCRYVTNGGLTGEAPLEGSLSDPDHDGTFTGTLLVAPLPDINSPTLGPVAPYAYTMTPYTPPDGGH